MKCFGLMLFCVLFSLFSATSTIASEALDKAQEAALIQTGIADMMQKAQRYGENKVYALVRGRGIEDPVAVVLFLQQKIVTKTLTIPLGRNRFSIQPDSIKVEIPL